jgi:hypothetical protein
MLFFRIFFAYVLIINSISENPKDRSLFISPVNIPLLLSANFGELRIDHFHSGIDIKTQGTTGKEVVAAASGYVSRISVSPIGFGNALYIRHPSGYTTVYGHLEKFSDEIAEYVKANQYEKKSFSVTLYPTKEKFPVKQGEIVAYSGNSGSSGGPHLHYEIRQTDNEKPVNPLFFEFGTSDNIAPVIEKLFIYPITSNTSINGKNNLRRIDVSGGHGNYYIPAENEILINGPAGFGIKSFDLLDDSYNKCDVYTIELQVDSMTVYKYVMDSFSFSESRYINSHIDYETYMKDKIYVQRTYLLPNNKLSTYKSLVNKGVFFFNEEKTYNARIIVTDVHNNVSNLTFHIKSKPENKLTAKEVIDSNILIMPYNKQNRFISENIKVNIPAGALYDTLKFSYNFIPGEQDMLSDIHKVHNKYQPVHRTYTIALKPKQIPQGKESKMLVIQKNDDEKKIPLKSSWSDGYLLAEAMSFGGFFIGIDTIPPKISANGLMANNDLTDRKEIRIRITDDLSGIKSYEPEIDGNWALFEYDQKNDILIYNIDGKRIKRNSEHVLKLKVTDNKDNISYIEYNFTW